jgi:hypothetical protein
MAERTHIVPAAGDGQPVAPDQVRPPTTAEVAESSFRRYGEARIIKAADLIYARPAGGQRLTLLGMRILNQMIAAAGRDGFRNEGLYSIRKADLRKGHNGNERIEDALEQLRHLRLEFTGLSPRGVKARGSLPLFGLEIEELEEPPPGTPADDAPLPAIAARGDGRIYFRFSDEAVALHRNSTIWAALVRAEMMKFEKSYSLRLYEIGCQVVRRRHPVLTLTIAQLRDLLNVEPKAYKDFAQLRRRTLDPAIEEVNQIAFFNASVENLAREGRKIVGLDLVFRMKDAGDAIEAAEEAERHSIGRRARRTGAVETVVAAADDPDPSGPPEAYWAAVAQAMRADRSIPVAIGHWLGEITLDRVEDGVAHLRAGNPFVRDYVNTHLDQALRRALAVTSGGTVKDFAITVAAGPS